MISRILVPGIIDIISNCIHNSDIINLIKTYPHIGDYIYYNYLVDIYVHDTEYAIYLMKYFKKIRLRMKPYQKNYNLPTSLFGLDLSYNTHITDEFLINPTNITSLDLSHNKIITDDVLKNSLKLQH